ncbi:MAG: hypothetical protein GXC94_07570 [Comamonadaceae bacterium]|nr:hypothetical protein [Comamonadaceae bacterium]
MLLIAAVALWPPSGPLDTAATLPVAAMPSRGPAPLAARPSASDAVAPPSAPAASQPTATVVYTLLAVLNETGQPPEAAIAVGRDGPRWVRPGDMLDGRYRLESLGTETALLRSVDGAPPLTLRLASRPEAPPVRMVSRSRMPVLPVATHAEPGPPGVSAGMPGGPPAVLGAPPAPAAGPAPELPAKATRSAR